jgi:hypothetical protein
VAFGTNAGGGTLSGTLTASAAGGVATFSNLSIDKTGTGYTLQAGGSGLGTGFSGAFNVTPAAPHHLVVVQQPSSTLAGNLIAPAMTVQVRDQFDNLVTFDNSNVQVVISNNPSGGTLSGTAVVAAVGGVATFSNLSIDKVGVGYTLFFGDGGLIGTTSAGFDIGPAASDHLAFATQPTTAVAGVAVSPAITIRVLDAFGNLATGDTSNVTLDIGTNAGGGTLGGMTTVAAVGGIATFSNVSINKVGTGYTLLASDASLGGATSTPFNITPAAAHHLVFGVQPSNAVAGVPISPPMTVKVLDRFDNLVTFDSSSVTLAIANNPGGASINGSLTISASGGIATFSNVIVGGIGTGYTLSASDAALTGTTSTSFNVVPGAAHHLLFGQQPTTAVAGAPISPAVTVRVVDAYNDLVPTDTSNVTLVIASNPGGAALGGTLTAAASGGIATFNNVTLDKVASGYKLLALDGILVPVTSGAFSITPAAADHLVFGQQPTNSAAGHAFSPAVTVRVLDRFNNLVTFDTSTVTLSISSNPAGGTLGGTIAVAASGGIATFNNAYLDKVGVGYSLNAADGALGGTTSSGFTIVPGAADHLQIAQQPTDIGVGQPITPAVKVQVLDAFGNLVTGDNSSVTASMAAGPTGGALLGTLTVQALGGVATFNNLSLNKIGTGYELAFKDGSLTGAVSNAFTVSVVSTTTTVNAVPTPSVYGQSVAFVATVTPVGPPGSTAPDGTVTFVIDSVNQPPAQVIKGVATINTSTLTTGLHKVRALYNGSTNFTASSSPTTPLMHVVGPANSNTILTSSTATAIAGSQVTLTATVSPVAPGAGKPSGTVSFFIDNVKVATVGLNATNFKAATVVKITTAGVHVLTAVYNGDTHFNVSPPSPVVAVTILPGAASRVTASAPPLLGVSALLPFTITVTAIDSQGNVATSYNNQPATLQVVSAPAGGTVIGPFTTTFVNGVAQFANLRVTKYGTYLVRITSGSLIVQLTLVSNGRLS